MRSQSVVIHAPDALLPGIDSYHLVVIAAAATATRLPRIHKPLLHDLAFIQVRRSCLCARRGPRT